MTQIELRGVQKYFGAVQVIKDLNLTIADNEFVVLLGPSGCGKTTTLRAIAGLETIDDGDILIDGKPVQDLKASDRDIAFVFQFFSLYPHLTVYENIAFPLRATRHEPRPTSTRRCARSPRCCASPTCSKRKPSALSGGDMQRVAIGRALVRRPKAMLMDEPIGALDAKLREEMRTEIKRLHLKQGSTTIYVTHDQVEAMALADRIVIMHEGVLQQVGTPEEVYGHPANLFVAQFVGSPVMNIAPAAVVAKRRQRHAWPSTARRGLRLPARAARRSSTAARASSCRSASGRRASSSRTRRPTASCRLEAHIIEPLGSYDIVDLKVGDADAARAHPLRLRRQGRRHGLRPPRPGADPFLRHQAQRQLSLGSSRLG